MIRSNLITALDAALGELPFVRAAWLGGADATDRVDEYSDVDLLVVAEDERVEDVFSALEPVLESLSPIDRRYRLPPPTWHGHEQAFYRFRDASPHTLLDLVVLELSSDERYLERERHGDAVVLLDRD
ncbi:MAG: nucleotidyltransferase domain-containing protein, partial [bacterium]|nr:nucleotidyltransferase domain-containing protein [bacterium]